MKALVLLIVFCLAAVMAASHAFANPILSPTPKPKSRFYSKEGREHAVSFRSVFRSDLTRIEDVQLMTEDAKASLIRGQILPLMDFMFGPLVNRELGSPQRATKITVEWSAARLVNGTIELPYVYDGLWIVNTDVVTAGRMTIPVPLKKGPLFSPRWKSCTDDAAEHQTPDFYWYFWDPTRYGCDHLEGVHYRSVTVAIGASTTFSQNSYPEYDRMTADGAMKITLAFGYVSDPAEFAPETDSDQGAYQYRLFLRRFKTKYGAAFIETPILQGEFESSTDRDLVIGHRFSGDVNGVKTTVNVLMAAGIDQMEVFAKSFAQDHDDLFAWFGHSRVGSGFDAQRFGWMVQANPQRYSISQDYQVIYWAGCNSYSYYTVPFFEFKGGTKNLDIVANGLPSYFAINADSAMIAVDTFLNWSKRPSYQSMVDAVEERGRRMGRKILTAVLGDEDNPL